jgi:hypothetical protein
MVERLAGKKKPPWIAAMAASNKVQGMNNEKEPVGQREPGEWLRTPMSK